MLGLTISERQMFIVPGKPGSENRKLRALLSTPIMNQKEQIGSAVRLLSSKPSPSDGLPPARLYHLKPPPKCHQLGTKQKFRFLGLWGTFFIQTITLAFTYLELTCPDILPQHQNHLCGLKISGSPRIFRLAPGWDGSIIQRFSISLV